MLLIDDEYVQLSVEPAQRLVRYTRKEAQFPSPDVYEAKLEEILRALSAVPLRLHVILVDLRAAKGRNDPRSEAVAARFRNEVMGRCARAAVLVGTSVGALQSRRHAKEDGVEPSTFHDERQALAWLLGG